VTIWHNIWSHRNECVFKEMSAEMDLPLMKRKKGVAPLLSYKYMLVQVKYILLYCTYLFILLVSIFLFFMFIYIYLYTTTTTTTTTTYLFACVSVFFHFLIAVFRKLLDRVGVWIVNSHLFLGLWII